MNLTRRDVARMALAGLPLARAVGAPNSRIHGVQIGVITYSFRPMSDVDEIIKTIVQIGLSEVELMSSSVEEFAGAPAMMRFPRPARPAAAASGQDRPRRQITPQQRAAMLARAEQLRAWRLSASMDRFKPLRKKFDDSGIDLHLLCFNMQDSMTDDEVDYAFQVARTLGVQAITTSTTVSMSKRIAPLADKHRMLVGYHGHDQTSDPNQFATLESYAAAFSYSKYNGVNLDIGHFTASNYDAIAFINQHHARITNLHLKDRKKDHGPNTPWGQGDTPLKPVLQLLQREKYRFPGNIELEYRIPEGSDATAEVAKCLRFCQDALA